MQFGFQETNERALSYAIVRAGSCKISYRRVLLGSDVTTVEIKIESRVRLGEPRTVAHVSLITIRCFFLPPANAPLRSHDETPKKEHVTRSDCPVTVPEELSADLSTISAIDDHLPYLSGYVR